jgi:hypothetical protein
MRRRSFITLLGGAAAWPLAARAQQQPGRMRRIGVLLTNAEADPEGQARFQVFRQGLADLGWVEGRNVRIDVRWAGGDDARQLSHAREFVALTPEVIVVNGTSATQGARPGHPAGGRGRRHSITSSARTRSAVGMVIPSAFASLRLTSSSILLDCCTGRSAGFSPLRIRPT